MSQPGPQEQPLEEQLQKVCLPVPIHFVTNATCPESEELKEASSFCCEQWQLLGCLYCFGAL